MSKFDFKQLRAQIQESGKILRDTFKGIDSHLIAGANKKNDPQWQEANRKKVESASWREATTQSNRQRAKDPNWLAATTEASRRKAQDPNWQQAIRMGNLKRMQKGQELKEQGKIEEFRKLFGIKDQHTEETKTKMSSSAKKRWAKTMRKVSALGKVYDNISAAAQDLGIHKDTVTYRIKTKPQDYFFLD